MAGIGVSQSTLGVLDIVPREKERSPDSDILKNQDKYEDLSGLSATKTDNPYDALIEASGNDPRQIQSRYETHRKTRNQKQKAILLDQSFTHMEIDQILYKLINNKQYPGFSDPRHCLVFWARPTRAIQQLIDQVQKRLLDVAPKLWLMPIDNLHMTTLEITHSMTESDIAARVALLTPKIEDITNFTLTHRTRLIKPMIGFDASALALSFTPAAGEGHPPESDAYTYHHLRRDLYSMCKSTDVEVASRYVVPSAHLTIARFVTQEDTCTVQEGKLVIDPAKMQILVNHIEKANEWLRSTYWPTESGTIVEGGQWMVGQERGLDCGYGTLWYGDATRLRIGDGF